MAPTPLVHPTPLPPPPKLAGAPLPPYVIWEPDGPDVTPKWLGSIFGIVVHRGASDRMRWLTTLTIVGILAGVVFAVLGRIPFDLPMPTHAIGMVTPTCGLTRGTVAILRGNFGLALHYNPGSFAVPLVALAALLRPVLGVLGRDRWYNVRFHPTRTTWAIGTVAFFSWWAYQQSNAMFIMHSHIV